MVDRKELQQLVAGIVDQVLTDRPTPAVASTSAAPRSVAIGADHGGARLKDVLAAHLRDQGYSVTDCGTTGSEAVDYPEFAGKVARLVAEGVCDSGVIVDGAGIGSCMVANKVPGVRAALCYDISSARNSREHNHANVLTLGAGLIGEALARQILDAWLATEWGGGRHARRVAMIDELDRQAG